MTDNTLTCPVCQSSDVSGLIEIRQAPVHCNLLWPTREGAAGAPRGDIRLSFCRHCGHLFNAAFNPALMEYTQAYENSLHFSPRFQSYAEALAAELVARYDLRGKDVIELGCGQGDFLRLLCRLEDNRGVGFDPSYSPDPDQPDTEQITFIQDFYSDRYADYRADLVCCRHVLEHIQHPREFIAGVRRSFGNRPGTAVFFEVPDVMYTLRDLGIWDLIYEHYSYFSRSSLAYLFRTSGFEVHRLGETYGGQFLTLEAFPANGNQPDPAGPPPEDDLEQIANLVGPFADRYRAKKGLWQRRLAQLAGESKRVVVWGAGSKGVTFLNVLRSRDQIEYVVDINPRKQGMYVAGTGQQIVAPDFLETYRPEVVIIMNSLYQPEIQKIVAGFGLKTTIECA